MYLIRTEKQKDNLAKYAWDLSKIVVAALGIAPFARAEPVDGKIVMVGLATGIVLALWGYLLDGMEVQR